MTIFINEQGYIETDLFTKPNLKNQLLLPYSAHPKFISKNIVFSLAVRVVRIVSDPEQREIRFQELADRLTSRHYSPGVVKAGIDRARGITREEALLEIDKETDSIQTPKLIVEFDPRTTPSFQAILNNNYQGMLEMDSRMKKVFPTCPKVVNKRGKNLKEVICRAKLPPKLGTLRTRSAAAHRRSGFRRCGRPRCPMCPYTGDAAEGRKAVKEVLVTSSNTKLTITQDMTCQTTNCIYLLTCSKDGQQYAGETGRTVAKRFAEHRDSMHNHDMLKPVGQHFQSAGHKQEADVVMLPIVKLKSDNIWVRKAMERKFINDHDLIDKGLNKYL